MKKWSTYIWKLIWVIGLFFLSIASFDILNHFKNSSHINTTSWASSIILFLWGIYLSLVFIKKWSIKINVPLLICVFIPSFLFSLIPLLTSILSISIPIGMLFLKIFSSNLIEIVAGLTFMLSIFDNSKTESE
ncbi:hypothetical protein [Sporosarcina aquimarina]|uniref:Uncharacterized protein n=1 Tax=Sporosarcina aquimarina TaxID=114975 RepID=A0ABU4FZB0_9BACL|nr:hypothetical protein [Sporosarcina aquimarina]MDW0110061.1 hypothetical protein [Sporosarcina aquimarina]